MFEYEREEDIEALQPIVQRAKEEKYCADLVIKWCIEQMETAGLDLKSTFMQFYISDLKYDCDKEIECLIERMVEGYDEYMEDKKQEIESESSDATPAGSDSE